MPAANSMPVDEVFMSSKTLTKPIILFFSVCLLYAAVLLPLYHIFLCDAVLSATLWLDLLDLLCRWCEIGEVMLFFGTLIFFRAHYKTADCQPVFFLAIGALLFKYGVSVLSLSLVYGSPKNVRGWGSMALSLVIEILECALVFFLAHSLIGKAERKRDALQRAKTTLGFEDTSSPSFLPLTSLFDFKNPVAACVGSGALLLLIVGSLSELLSQIAYSLAGVPFRLSDLPSTLLYWFLLVLLPSFLSYVFTFLCFSKVKEK